MFGKTFVLACVLAGLLGACDSAPQPPELPRRLPEVEASVPQAKAPGGIRLDGSAKVGIKLSKE